MDHSSLLIDMIKSIPQYKNVILISCFINTDKKDLENIGFSNNDIEKVTEFIKDILEERLQIFTSDIKNIKESILESILRPIKREINQVANNYHKI